MVTPADGILAYTEALHPDITGEVADQALQLATRVAEGIGHVGVLVVECFRVGDEWLVNEVAWCIPDIGRSVRLSAAENHLRGIWLSSPKPRHGNFGNGQPSRVRNIPEQPC